MTSNKNILLILPFLPFPLSSGGAQAILNGIEAIPDDFHVFITYWTNDMERNIHDEEKLKEKMH